MQPQISADMFEEPSMLREKSKTQIVKEQSEQEQHQSQRWKQMKSASLGGQVDSSQEWPAQPKQTIDSSKDMSGEPVPQEVIVDETGRPAAKPPRKYSDWAD